MAVWDNKKYDDEATRIAKAFTAGHGQNGAGLTELVEKTARQSGLNPEQIRRLTRVANIRSWEEKFAGMKTAESSDRNVEFELGSEQEVIRRLHGDAAAMVNIAIKTASEVVSPALAFPDLPNDMDEVRRPLPKESGTYKRASTPDPLEVLRPDIEVLKLLKLADTVEVKMAAARFAWQDAMQSLIEETRKSTWSEDRAAEFEKSAVALHGLEVVPELNALRRIRGERILPMTREKVAGLRDRVYGEASRATSLIKTASVARKERAMLEDAQKAVTKKLATLKAQLGLRKVGG